jgi:hypothetical protein
MACLWYTAAAEAAPNGRDVLVKLKRDDDLAPLCPHCEAEAREIHMQELRGVFGRRYLYFCASCRKILGVSHRKGFFMG